MFDYHARTYEVLGGRPCRNAAAARSLDALARRLGGPVPEAVHAWYSLEGAIEILNRHSNSDRHPAVDELATRRTPGGWEGLGRGLLVFRIENQGVCRWAIQLSNEEPAEREDPPVLVEFEAGSGNWEEYAESFSTHVFTSVWDYARVLHRPALVQAQNVPLSADAIGFLERRFNVLPKTWGGPGGGHHRFEGLGGAVLIWANEDQADWHLAAPSVDELVELVGALWELDEVGPRLYATSPEGERALRVVRSGRGR